MQKSVLALIIYFFTISLQAQSLANAEKSILWEISGNELEKPSYIFGTMHLVPKDDYFFTEKMQEKFNTCKKLILEVDINMPLKEQIEIAKQMMLPKGKLLSDYMTDKEFEKFKSYILDTLKIKKSTFKKINKIKPLIGSSLMLSELIGKSKTYEKELNKLAKKNDMQVEGLETMEFQMNLINSISVEEQIEMMNNDELSGNPLDAYNEMLKVYKEQDLLKLKELMDADDSMATIEDDFLKNRNKDWIPKIEKLAKNNSVFIAVGAGHLAGDDGILQLLKDKGYTVNAVK